MLAARKVPAAAEVDRGPAREPDVGRAGPPRARRRCSMALRRRRRDPRRHASTTCRTSAPTRRRGRSAPPPRSGCCSPGPYRIPVATWATTSVFSNTPGRTAYRGPVAVRVGGPRGAARHRRPAHRASIPSSCAAGTSSRRDDLPYANPIGMPYDHMSPREVFEAALEMLDYDAFRREQATARARGPLPRRRHLQLRRADQRPAWATTAPRAPRSASSRPARSTCTWPAGPPGTASRPRPCSSPPTPSASTSRTSHTIQGDTAVTPFGLGTGGSRSGSMIAGAIAATAATLRERIVAIAAHKLEAAPEDIELAEQPGHACGARRPIGLVAGRDRRPSPTPTRRRCRPGVPPGLEASGRYQAQAPMIWANATHVCTCEVDVGHRRRHAAALHRQRGLRADDQPERGGGPDRRRHRAGDRRRAARAPRLRRRRQPGDDDLRRLPAADHRRRAGDRARATSRRPGPGPAATRASARAAPSAPRRRWSTRSPTRIGVDITRLPITPPSVLALLDANGRRPT